MMRADRLLSILFLLQTGGRRTAHDLAERLEVSERTIYRDLDALSAAGVPVYAAPGPGGGVALTAGFRSDLTGLTAAEAGGLFVGGASGPLADIGIGTARDAAFLKLLAALPAAQRRAAQRVQERVLLDAARWHQPAEELPHLDTIREALFRDRVLGLTYRRDDGSTSERRVAPLGLVAKASVWYLVGDAADHPGAEGRRVYRASRVLAAILTDEEAHRPPDFALAAFWAEWSAAFAQRLPRVAVTLRVEPGLVPALPQIFGDGTRRLLEGAASDAAGWTVLTLTFDSWETARTAMLGLGDRGEVLAPPEMRAAVVERAAAILAAYGPAVGRAE